MRHLTKLLWLLSITALVGNTCGMLPTFQTRTLLDVVKNYLLPTQNIKTTEEPKHKTYDFIIVGAGTGGSVLANRLSENKHWKILLLEAGKPEGLFNQIPLFVSFFQQTDYNYGYNVEPQKNACLGMIDHRCSYPRGKSLGGTSTLNYMIHTRGNKLDYDLWASLGNKGWSYEDVLPYFRKSERFNVPGISNNSRYHGDCGYLCVENVPYHTKVATAFLKAGKQLGYDIVDYNGEQAIGFSYIQANMDRGTRCSASRAYLHVDRPNLDIVTGATVTKVLIDKHKRAYGVEYAKNKKTRKVECSKEVILSAGALDSAKLLMLSGIGPKDHLKDLDIEVVKDCKVGYNLKDHVGFLGLTFLANQSVTILQNRITRPSVLLEYLLERSGPMSIPGGAESLAFIRTKYAQDDRPDVELLLASGSISSDSGMSVRIGHRISDKVYNTVFKPIENQDAYSIWPIVQNPRSVGRVTLSSKDPFAPPKADPNFLSHPADIEIVLEGLKHALKVAKMDALQAYGSRVHDVKIPGCEYYEFGSDDYWRCAIRHLPAMLNHECGTAKMGPSKDPDAVVDPQLRVYGIKALRVVDASIFPTIPTGHINAGIYMIGEKAADMIKESWPKNDY